MIDELYDLAYPICDWLVDVSAEPGFWVGFWLGVVVLAMATFLIFMIRIWWGEVTAPYRPQALVHTTARTPAQVTRRGCMVLVLGIAIAVAVLFVVLRLFYPEVLWALGL